jgi:serine/threonine protein kinase
VSYCINPLCNERQNPDNAENCLGCGNSLLINGRIRLLRPLTSLNDELSYTDVFEVEDTGTQSHPEPRTRVMKVLYWNNEFKYVELLQRESFILQLLDHPGIPKSNRKDYFTFILNDNILELHCLVMQKFEGDNLAEWVKIYGRITQDVAFEWLLQLINILDNVHRSGFFHRDIKPENIIYQPNGKLALVDFGGARQITRTYLMKVSTSGGSSTGLGSGHEITAIRTACYSPLEQINGQAVPQSDFYALGRTFVYLVTGTSLIGIKSNAKTGKLLWRDKARHIDKSIADLIDDLMAPFPGQRPQNTQIILQRLKKLPLQRKIQRVIRSKTFIISAAITSMTLVGSGVFKIIVPALANALVAQGERSEAAKDTQSAQIFFGWAIKINPSTKLAISKYYFYKASRSIDNPKVAKKNYELAVKYNNQDIDAYNILGITCQQLADNECVKNVYKKLFELKQNYWQGHYNLGSFYDSQGEYELAEKEYNIAIQSSNEAVLAINNLSRLKIKTGDYNTAISLANKGLQKTKDPVTKAALYKNLGWASLEQKKISDAEKYLERAISLDVQRIDAYCLLSKVQEALGKIDDSRISVEVCLLAKSTDSDIFIWRQELLDGLLKK